MKCIVILASLAVVCLAPNILDLIRHEVQALLKADPNLTVGHCTTKCDALFDLVDGHDETGTDRACHYECNCLINHQCNHHHHGFHIRPPRTTHAN